MRRIAVNALHLLALWSIAVAQPLYDVLGRNAAFFAVRRSTAAEIIAFVAVTTVAAPLIIAAVEGVVALASRSAAWIVHLAFVAVLAAAIALQIAKRVPGSEPTWLIAPAVAAGVVAAYAYARTPALRTTLTVLAIAPAVFVGFFLFGTPVGRLLATAPTYAARADVAATTPVVLVIFDELPTSSLMLPDGRLDDRSFPAFARLARDAVWFRRARAAHWDTTRAIPAVMTGRRVAHGRLPTYADHPENLFTLLGGRYRMNVHEPITSLCPASLCVGDAPAVTPGLRPLLNDSSVLFLHLLLPVEATRDLPPLAGRWGDFRSGARTRAPARRAASDGIEGRHPARFQRFVRSIRPSAAPRLSLLHSVLPHHPWQYLANGRRYLLPDDFDLPPGLDGEMQWSRDPMLVRQALARHLLQARFADRLLHRLLVRLRETGVYERALVVVTADHGASFRPNDQFREPTRTNVQDIAFVPLFVKLPDGHGRISDVSAQTIDVVPTIADVLGIQLPWDVDGTSLLADRRIGAPVSIDGVEITETEAVRRQARTSAVAQSILAGMRTSRRAAVPGPFPGLVGRAVATLPVSPQTLSGHIEDESLFRFVRPGGVFYPGFVKGALDGEAARSGVAIAIAVDGLVRATTRSYRFRGRVEFGAVVPPDAFHPGSNRVDVYSVSNPPLGPTLTPIATAGEEPAEPGTIRRDARGGQVVRTAAGTLPAIPGVITGSVTAAVTEGHVQFSGWAGDVRRRQPRERVLVFADGTLVYSYDEEQVRSRPDLGPGLADAGFAFKLPLRELIRTDGSRRDVQLFAVIGRQTGELEYPLEYAWAPHAVARRRFELVVREGRELLVWEAGNVPVVRAGLSGYLDTASRANSAVFFGGWAADTAAKRPRAAVVVFADGEHVATYDIPSRGVRVDLGPELADAGFAFRVPLTALGRAPRTVRLFAVVGRRAVELQYPPGYRWRPR